MTVLSLDGHFDPAQPATEFELDPTFTEAVEFIGGCVVPDLDAIVVQISLRTAMRLAKLDKRFGVQRIWYRSLDDVDPDHYGVVLDLYYLQRDGFEAHGDVVLCRRCRPRGVDTPATVEIFGRLAVCAPCFQRVRPALPEGDVIRVPLGRDCTRCYAPIYFGPNLRAQLETVGRFTGLCPDCWHTRAVVTTPTGEITTGAAGQRPPSDRAPDDGLARPAAMSTLGGWVVGTVTGRATRDSFDGERAGNRVPLPVPHLQPANRTTPGIRQETWFCRPCDGSHRRIVRTLELPDDEPTPRVPLPYGFLPTCTGQRRAERLEELASERPAPAKPAPGTCTFCGGANTTERIELGLHHCTGDECVTKHVEARRAVMAAEARAAKAAE